MNIAINQIIMLVVSVVIFGGAYWLFRSLAADVKKSKMSLGDYFNNKFISEFVGYTIITLIVLNISEALVAAFIHPTGEQQLNQATRFAMHFSIGMVAVLFQVNLAKTISDFTSGFQVNNKAHIGLTIVRAFMMLFCAAIAFGLPYANIMIIANGLEQVDHFRYFVDDYVFFWKDMEAEYELMGLTVWDESTQSYSSYYDPYKALDYQMFSSVVMWGTHNALGLFDGFVALERDLKIKSVKATAAGKMQIVDKVKDLLKDPEKAALHLIKFVGTLTDTEAKTKAKLCGDKHAALNGTPKNKLSVNLTTHLTAVLNFLEDKNKSAYSAAVLNQKRDKIILELEAFFVADSTTGAGFSEML